jgi:hypothetical protein
MGNFGNKLVLYHNGKEVSRIDAGYVSQKEFKEDYARRHKIPVSELKVVKVPSIRIV